MRPRGSVILSTKLVPCLPLIDGGLLFRCPEGAGIGQHVAVGIEGHPPDVTARVGDKGLRNLAVRVYRVLESVRAPVCLGLLDDSASVIISVGEEDNSPSIPDRKHSIGDVVRIFRHTFRGVDYFSQAPLIVIVIADDPPYIVPHLNNFAKVSSSLSVNSSHRRLEKLPERPSHGLRVLVQLKSCCREDPL